jgi:hypothetical protein
MDLERVCLYIGYLLIIVEVMRGMLLVRVDADKEVKTLVSQPITMIFLDGLGNADVEVIERHGDVVCDACGRAIALDQEDLEKGLIPGYALVDEGYIVEVICDECRRRYYPRLKIYNTLEEAGIL